MLWTATHTGPAGQTRKDPSLAERWGGRQGLGALSCWHQRASLTRDFGAGCGCGGYRAGSCLFSLTLVLTGLSSWYRMDDSYCLSALRSPFYPIPTPGSLPPLHPSAMHLHLSGVRYPPELSHSSLAALHSERMSSLSAER